MKLYHKNPRTITSRQYADLEKWLDELGDLSGIVHDLNSDEVIGGNQRARIFGMDDAEIVVEHEQEPDDQGTVGLGYVIWRGHRFTYRQVRWTEGQAAKANIIANRSGGDWDFDVLANEFELDKLLAWGFEDWEFGGIGETPDLDDLADEYGDHDERDFWPVIKVQVAPETFDLYESLMAEIPDMDEAEQFAILLSAVDASVLSTELP